MADKWIYNYSEDGVWGNSEEYDSKEEAIKNGIEQAKEEGWGALFVARAVPIIPEIQVDADEIIENTAIRIDEEYDYNCDLNFGAHLEESFKKEDIRLLQEMLDKTIEDWQAKINYTPPLMFSCEDVEQIPMPEEKQ